MYRRIWSLFSASSRFAPTFLHSTWPIWRNAALDYEVQGRRIPTTGRFVDGLHPFSAQGVQQGFQGRAIGMLRGLPGGARCLDFSEVFRPGQRLGILLRHRFRVLDVLDGISHVANDVLRRLQYSVVETGAV